ncbi:hypothetical protein [Corynebacterium freneyi]|uniref:hypothetical protein n=1 Tax=Corynebacterium freneyi TaxID=134034 RepID=UPI001CC97580|nr:hypothetical protein [Corynebacterium freneyi]UBI01582.1 hypothetical protein LA334_08600 [Corynebacterium freneyi]
MPQKVTLTPWAMLVAAGASEEDATWLVMQLPIIGYGDVPAIAEVIARATAAGRCSACDLMHLRMAPGVRQSPAAAVLAELQPGATIEQLRAALDEAEQVRLAELGVIPR